MLIPLRVKPVVPKSIGQLAKVEFNEEAVVVIEIDGLACVLEIVEVDEITGATAFAVGAERNETPEATKKVADTNEIIFFNMEGPLNAMSLLDATTLKFKLLSQNGLLY